MYTFSAFTLGAVLLANVNGLAVPNQTPSDILKRAGPSGYVIYPSGGTTFENDGGNNDAGGIEYIHIRYQGVNQDSPFVATVGVDIYLEDPTGQQADMLMATDYGSATGDIIDGYFSPPAHACGTYNLVFIEHQNLGISGQTIDFRAAAPSITIVCPPIQ